MADWIIYIRSEAICRLKPFPLQVCGLHSRILMESKKWKKLKKNQKKSGRLLILGIKKEPSWCCGIFTQTIYIYIHFIFFKWSKKIWNQNVLKKYLIPPPQDKNKIGTKWQFDLSWSYHLLNQHQRDVWNAGISFCVDKTCLREPPFPQYTTPRSDREQRRYLDLRCYPQSDLAVPRMQLFFQDMLMRFFLLFSSLSLFFFLAVYTCRLRLWGLRSF